MEFESSSNDIVFAVFCCGKVASLSPTLINVSARFLSPSDPLHTLGCLREPPIAHSLPVAYHGDLTDEADRIGVPAHRALAHALVNHGTEFRGPGGVAVDHGRRVMCVSQREGWQASGRVFFIDQCVFVLCILFF